MPQRKKKKNASSKATTLHALSTVLPQKQQDDSDDSVRKDVLACLDELDNLLTVASISEADCIAGIRKADRALERCLKDGDVQCAILMKRAQLLKTVVEKRYSTSGLAARHHSPLDSCIADCQEVLSSLKCSGSSTLYQDAQRLATHAKKLKREDDPEVRTRSGSTTTTPSHWASSTSQRFDPEKTLFKDISKINPILLQDVINCYKKCKFVCRTCFMRHNWQEILLGGKPCRYCKNTATIRIIPASKLCKNFRDLKIVAIPPPPKILMSPMNRHKPFQYCRNTEHITCYDRAKESWYAHSIEEIVIWTVERYWCCTFTEYVNNYHSPIDMPTTVGSKVKPKDVDSIDSFSDELPEKEYEFFPSEAVFPQGLASIPKHLLDNVVKCYSEMKEYCKVCFYKHGKKGEVGIGPHNCFICKLCHGAWHCVVVIPASPLCWNFGDFDLLPVANCPRSKPIPSPFEYCRKDDHYRCFRVYIETEFWYVHSVEELVIWTVEREKDCTFSQFVNKTLKPSLPPPGLTLSSPLSPSPLHSGSLMNSTQSETVPVASGMRGQNLGRVPSPLSGPPLSPSSPSFSQVVAGSQSKSRPPSAGLGGKDRPLHTAGNEQMSPNSVSSLDQAIMANPVSGQSDTSSVPSQPYSNAFDSLTQPVHSTHFEKLASSPDSFVSAMSQGTFGSSHGIGRSDPINSTVVPNTTISKASLIRGRPNYKVANSRRNNELSTEGQFDKVPAQTFDSRAAFVASQPSGYPSSCEESTYPLRVDNSNKVLNSADTSTDSSVRSVTFEGTKQQQEVFKYSLINFHSFAEIPLRLVAAIAMAFQERRKVCRKCFYGDRNLSSNEGDMCGEGQHQWDNPIVVIPACKECNNEPCFDRSDYLPLPPLPPVANIRKCSQKNHHKCFQKCLESNPRFAHSVQELVVWIIESEKDCTFADFIHAELESLFSPSRPESPPQHAPHSGTKSNIVSSNLRPVSSETQTSVQLPCQPPSPILGTRISQPPSGAKPVPKTQPLTPKYNAKNVAFQCIRDIPLELLTAVALCFKFHKVVCRQCFFSSGCRQLTTTKKSNTCIDGHQWRPLIIMPGCRLCSNFNHSTHIPVLPIPKHMKSVTSPFCICNKKGDHQQCYLMSKSTNPWFPHTVEELVIWTVERERSVPFESVYKSYLPSPGDDITPETVMFLQAPPSSPSSTVLRHKTKVQPPSSTHRGKDGSKGGQAVVGEGDGLTPRAVAVESLHSVSNVAAGKAVNHSRRSDVDGVGLVDPSGGDFRGASQRTGNESLASVAPEVGHVSDPILQKTGSQNGNRTDIPPGSMAIQTGLASNMSLFQDPLLHLNACSNNDHDQRLAKNSERFLSATLEYFPALRASVGIESGDSNAVDLSNVKPGNTGVPSVQEAVVEHKHYQVHVQDSPETNMSVQSQSGYSNTSNSNKQEPIPISPVLNEQFDNAEHYKYRSSKSSTLPENWPDIPSQSTANAHSGVNQLPNNQGHDVSTPHNTQESVVEQEATEGGMDSSKDVQVPKVDEDKQNVDSQLATKPVAARRESLDVNAKVFTPKGVVKETTGVPVQVAPKTRPSSYPSGLNPNAASYLYLTNGGSQRGPVSAPAQSHAGSTVTEPEDSSSQTQLNSPLSVTSAATNASPTSQIPDLSTDALLKPTSASLPHTCLFCYVGFPDTASLRQHCKTAAHVRTLLCDCGAATIWKHLPPPPDQLLQWKLCPNGRSCGASRLDCCQPHFADELAEWHRRTEHHVRRETGSLSLPEFSDQRNGVLITPQEDITLYSSLRVSVEEPLQAVLNDSSASFTWTISVEGENWQTLFGIHLKSSTPVFHITDLENANTQSSGNSQASRFIDKLLSRIAENVMLPIPMPRFVTIELVVSDYGHLKWPSRSDRANWIVMSPEDAILLGQLLFSVRVTPDQQNKNYSCKVCLNLGFCQYVYISLALVVKDPKYSLSMKPHSPTRDQQQHPTTDVPSNVLQREQEHTLTLTPEPSANLHPVSLESDPIVQNSLQGAKQVLRFHSFGPRQSTSAGEGGVGRDEMGSETPTPTREGSGPLWQISDSSGDDLGIEAEDTTLHHEPIEDQIYSLTDHLTADDVTSSTKLHVQSTTDA